MAVRRRKVICSLLAAPLAVRAQRGVAAHIGYVSMRNGPNEFEQAFFLGLREIGWIDGSNLVIDFRWADGKPEHLEAMVAELVAMAPALIVVADSAVQSLRALTTAMPIVHPLMADPIADGFATSLSHPDRNLTGISTFGTELSHKRLELFTQAMPGLRRVGALVNVKRSRTGNVAATHAAGEALGVEVIDVPVALPDGVMAGFVKAIRLGAQGVVVVSDPSTISHRQVLCDAALTHRVPTIFSNRAYLRDGGLMSYGPNLDVGFHRAAYLVDRMLKGAKPGDLPIEQTTDFHLVLNQRTANLMNFSFPRALVLRADQLIE